MVICINSFEQTRHTVTSVKTEYKQQQKRVNSTDNSVRFKQFACTAATCVLAVCMTVPVVNACSIATTLNITDNRHTASMPAQGYTQEVQSTYSELSDTVFGTQFAQDVVSAVDVQAYNKALAYDVAIQAKHDEEIARMYDAERFYIPEITLDYEAEKIYVPYETQKFIWDTCNELDLDYFLVMGIIARESRFQLDITSCTNGITYYGGMQVSGRYWYDMCSEAGGDTTTMTPYNAHDNLWVGMHFLAYCIEQTGSEYAGVMAYGMGLGAYNESISNGVYSDRITDKAYKYRKLLLKNTRYSVDKDGALYV